MSDVGQVERKAQERVVRMFRDQLGYEYLGNWEYREANANIEVDLLTQNLRARGYDDNLITRTLDQLGKAASLGAGRDLYEANQDVYRAAALRREGQARVGEQTETVWLIDWATPAPTTLRSPRKSLCSVNTPSVLTSCCTSTASRWRVLELKRSKVSVSEGIRQNLDNQKPEFIRPFFSTMQWSWRATTPRGCATASSTRRRSTTWLEWKEPSEVASDQRSTAPAAAVREGPVPELIHDFMVFDAGVKKPAGTTSTSA
jgi:type I restriction enzyme R subunit